MADSIIPDAYSVLNSTLACLVGNLVGELSDKIIAAIEIRKYGLNTAANAMGMSTGGLEFVERFLQIFLQVGLESMMAKVVLSGLPQIEQSAANYSMFGMGLMFSSPHLAENLHFMNGVIFGALYADKGSLSQMNIVSDPVLPANKTIS